MEHKMHMAGICLLATTMALTPAAAWAQDAATSALNPAATSAACPGNAEALGVANVRAISSVVRTIEAPDFNDRFSAVR
jgi:hypothetical protein